MESGEITVSEDIGGSNIGRVGLFVLMDSFIIDWNIVKTFVILTTFNIFRFGSMMEVNGGEG